MNKYFKLFINKVFIGQLKILKLFCFLIFFLPSFFLLDIVLCLMISVAATSIVWSLSIHVLSGDFYNGFIGAKLVFRERDLEQMEQQERHIWKHDLDRVLNETYAIEDLDQLKADALVMPKLTQEQR